MAVTTVGNKGKRVRKKSGSAEREPGIMFNWIASKMLDYEEPERRGTSRGEKIGYPKNKYFASLFIGLSNFSQKKLSDDLGQGHSIRYGVLRNWCREKDFKEMAKGHAGEFANHLILHVETKCEESMSEWNDYFNLKTDEQPPELQFDEIYRDAMFFNESVLNAIAGLCFPFYEVAAGEFDKGRMDTNGFYHIAVVHAEIFKILTYASGGEYPKELKIKSEKAMIGQIKSIISSKRILSKKEQRFIIHAAETLEKWQEEKLIDEAGHKEKK